MDQLKQNGLRTILPQRSGKDAEQAWVDFYYGSHETVKIMKMSLCHSIPVLQVANMASITMDQLSKVSPRIVIMHPVDSPSEATLTTKAGQKFNQKTFMSG